MVSAPSAPSAPPVSRIRLTSIAGTLAAMTVAFSFFLPWVAVPPEEAEHFRVEMERRLADPAEGLPAGVHAEDWRRLAALAAEQGEVSGLDVFYWARTAHATALAYERAEAAAESETSGSAGSAREESGLSGSSSVSRAILLVAVALAGLHVVAVIVAVAFLVGRLHRAQSPVLILALLAGALAVAIPAAYSIATPALGFETHPRSGLFLLLPAGGMLLLTGVFGVRRGNWWSVLVGTLLVGGLLVLLAWGYVASGT